MPTISAMTKLRKILTEDATLKGYEVTEDLLVAFARLLDKRTTPEDVAGAYLAHRSQSDTRFTPAVVNEWMRAERLERHRRRAYDPPQSLDGEPARELPWRRTYNSHCAAGLAHHDAYLRACAEHHCDPDAAFASDQDREQAYAAIEAYAQSRAVPDE